MAEYSYTVLFEPAEEGGYVVFCPALPGLVAEGDTYDEAHERVTEAIEGYLESLVKDGLPIPPDKKITLDPVKEEIRIALPNRHEPTSACSQTLKSLTGSAEGRLLYSPH